MAKVVKKNTITLVQVAKPEVAGEFEMSHALNLLQRERLSGKVHWKIASSEEFDFVDNDIIRRASTGDLKESK